MEACNWQQLSHSPLADTQELGAQIPAMAALGAELGPESQPGMSLPDQDRPACPEVRLGSQPIVLPPVPGILSLTYHTWGQGGAWDGLGWASAEATEGWGRREPRRGGREQG